jgi:integrase
MPAKRIKERVVGTYFVWLLGRRKGVYYADGRSNATSAGRHSLGTKNRSQALECLKTLDLVRAVEIGLADRASLSARKPGPIGLADGRRLYMNHAQRPRIVGGARPSSVKRYRAVFDKFEKFAQSEGVAVWNHVSRRTLEAYAAHLDDEGYAYATEYLELTTLKQVVKWLTDEGHLPASCRIHLPLEKPQGTTTYCWRAEEVQAMVRHCRTHVELDWLGDVLTALACTGLRISELASLRRSDIDLEKNLIRLTDESTQPKRKRQQVRQTKSGRGRSFPVHQDLQPVVEKLLRSKGDGFVFHGPKGGRLKPDTIRQTLVRSVLTALEEEFPPRDGELGFKDGRLHSFRHYFASTCANSGVPEQVVMRWLGHQDSRMVQGYYHLHDEVAQRQMERLSFVGAKSSAAASAHTS